MADATLNVAIQADINDFSRNLNKANKDLDKFSSGVDTDLKNLSKTLSNDLKKGANQASQSLTDLGRIVQDAPFGFIGIQNNISPLIDSFGRLKAESGSTGGALKSLIGGLAGPAGLGLAIAGVTSAITVLTQNPELITSFFDSLSGGASEASKAQNELNKAFVDSVSSVQGEISNIKSLVSIAKDESLSRKERLEAINQLNKQYPELNNQLSLETINSENATKAINGLNKALIVRAKIAAVQELIGEEFKKQLQDQNKAIQGQASALDKLGAFFQAALGPAGIFKANQTLVTSGIEEQNKALKSSNQTISVYEKTLDELNKTLAKTGNLFVDPNNDEKSNKILKTRVELLKGIGVGTKQDFKDAGLQVAQFGFIVGDTFGNIEKLVNSSKGTLTPDIDTKAFEESLKRFQELGISGINSFKNEFEGLIIDFSPLASGIAEGLAGVLSGTESMGDAILSAFGAFLGSFGDQLIKFGLASEAFAALQASIFAGGLVSIPLALAVIASGIALKAFASNIMGTQNAKSAGSTKPSSIPQFAGGVTGFNGGMALVGERGPELVTMGRGANVITNENVNRFMSRGNGNINVVATVGISMGQLVVGLEREKKLMNRTT